MALPLDCMSHQCSRRRSRAGLPPSRPPSPSGLAAAATDGPCAPSAPAPHGATALLTTQGFDQAHALNRAVAFFFVFRAVPPHRAAPPRSAGPPRAGLWGVRDRTGAGPRGRAAAAACRLTCASAVQCFGTFETAQEAAHIYDLAVRHIYGEDAVLNFPLTTYIDGERRLQEQWRAKVPAAALAAKEKGICRKGQKAVPAAAATAKGAAAAK